jgi:hypothetical protein
VDERTALASILHTWRLTTHSRDNLAPVRPLSYLLSDESIDKLAKLPMPKDISATTITEVLNETHEWSERFADGIRSAISEFDSAMINLKKADLATVNSTGDIARLLGGDHSSTSIVVKAIHLVVLQKKENARVSQTRRAEKSAKENTNANKENVVEEGDPESSADEEPATKRSRVLVLSETLNVV